MRLAASIVLGLALAPSHAGTADVTFADRLWSFNQAYARFFRVYFGCPLEAFEESQCSPTTRARFDYPGYVKARKAAMKLFDLHD